MAQVDRILDEEYDIDLTKERDKKGLRMMSFKEIEDYQPFNKLTLGRVALQKARYYKNSGCKVVLLTDSKRIYLIVEGNSLAVC